MRAHVVIIDSFWSRLTAGLLALGPSHLRVRVTIQQLDPLPARSQLRIVVNWRVLIDDWEVLGESLG